MKKLATALVSAAAIMTMSTTAFAAENPAEVFDRVMEKNNTIQSAEIQSGVHSVILAKDVIPDGQMKVDMAMHAEMDMQDTTDLKYLAQVASSILGQDSYSQVFYTDGYYYVDTNGVKLKYPMPLEQIISSVQTGVNTSNMESSYMKGISLNEVNGKRVLAYEANPKKLNKNVKEALAAACCRTEFLCFQLCLLCFHLLLHFLCLLHQIVHVARHTSRKSTSFCH